MATATVVTPATSAEPPAPYVARAFTPAHADLSRSAGLPAQLANEEYVEALARIVAPASFLALTPPAPRWC